MNWSLNRLGVSVTSAALVVLCFHGIAHSGPGGSVDALESAAEQYESCRYDKCGGKTGPEKKSCHDACAKSNPKGAEYWKVRGCRVDCLEHPPLGTKRFDCVRKCANPWDKLPYPTLDKCKKKSGDFNKCAIAALNGEADPGATPVKKVKEKTPDPEFAGKWDGFSQDDKGKQVGTIVFHVNSQKTKVKLEGFTIDGVAKCDPSDASAGMAKSTDGKPAFSITFQKGCDVPSASFQVLAKFKTTTESATQSGKKGGPPLVTPTAVGELQGKWYSFPKGRIPRKSDKVYSSVNLTFVAYRTCEKDAECKGKGERCINIPGAQFGTCGVFAK